MPASEIVERFSRICRDEGGRPLVHLASAGRTLSATDLSEYARAGRRTLERVGLAPGTLVIYAAGNRPELFGCFLACRSVGAPMLLLDGGTPAPEIEALARRFGASLVIGGEAISGLSGFAASEPYAGELRVATAAANAAPGLFEGAAVLKVTSGSTDAPKATFTTETQLVNDGTHVMTAMDIRPDDCQIAAIPLSHSYGLGNLVLPLLLSGTRLVLRDGFVPHQFHADASRYGARIFPGVPFMFDHFNDQFPPGAWPRQVETVISAGARLEPAAVRSFASSFGVKIHSFYGTSETGGITYDDASDLDALPSVGRPLPGVMVSLRPELGVAPPGGRVHVTSDAVSSGYAGQPADDAFVDGGFLTGDLGSMDERGNLVLTGRVSAFINVAGRKVVPQEVEDVLRGMPDIADVRVLGVPDPIRGERIVACIVPRAAAPDTMAVRSFCAARLAAHKLPRAVVVLERIPLTARGKVDTRELQRIALDRLRNGSGSAVL